MTLDLNLPQVLIAYHSHGGNTRKMAEALAQAVSDTGCEAILETVGESAMEKLPSVDGLLLGSPCYFGSMATPVKQFLDDSIKFFGKGMLVGKAAGVFCSTGNIGGGGETTLISMTLGLMIHGMVIQGIKSGGHFGPLAIGEPDERVLAECRDYGEQFSGLVKTLFADLY
ncbi:MAG: NAD(P)H-dependent oxidoreductase [Desulfarculaceae bacterium]|nr:NAD(P)H-dependent oxidoreductase [Desulfarculaceae bacterium]MCF8073483.1 NAD(P)H-dependent oxidoreductase [Desulfarculaceae bacterium]MCF8100370.1 NAD(P)H-dependent oxidoreductase [Desulfarculaceae bacterium]MCF8115894.1 NAD(P)H-dependent oxidoreductase [Desulfarculaceae bacterium]